MLQASHLKIGYRPPRAPELVVAADLSVSLEAGELVCLVGPNGAGKTTLLRTLAGLQPPLRGQVLLEGGDVHCMPARERARRLAVVLTERIAAGLLSVYELVALGRFPYTGWTGKLREADHRSVRRALRAAGAEALSARSVGELSDGERQRVLVARALAQEARILILDEVTAYLDLPRRVDVLRLLRRLAHETRRAVLLTTHDLDLALRSADRMWLLPQGGPLAAGAPEDLVLSGAFEAGFAAEGVDFDRASGSFRIQYPSRGGVALRGDGVAAFWTRRALERRGFGVTMDGSSSGVRIEILEEDGRRRWRLLRGQERATFGSLGALTRTLAGGSFENTPQELGAPAGP